MIDRFLFSAVSAALLSLTACKPVSAEAPRSVEAPHPTELAPLMGGPPTFWWTHAGEMSAVTVAFGAAFLDSAGVPRRPWALSAFRPGSGHPLLIFQSAVDLRGSESLGAGAGEFSVHLLPAEGRTWADVTEVAHLAATVGGIY